VSFLGGRKDTGASDKKVTAAKGLIKPRMGDAQALQTPKIAENAGQSKSDEKKAASVRDQPDEKPPALAKSVAALDNRDVDKPASPGKKSDAVAKPLRQASDDALPAKRESVHAEASPKPDPGKQTPKPSGDTTKEGDDTPFKKHDHSKYIAVIRGKAIDHVNKEKDVALARVCRDTTTEEWSLTLYRKKQQTYSFVSYVWDEIDGKWEQVFVSDQRPLSGWKHHLDFSSSGKECIPLKGSPP
jgi:hypothetical protein